MPPGVYPRPPSRRIERICHHCDKSFTAYPGVLKTGRAIYCSPECRVEGTRPPRPPITFSEDGYTATFPLYGRSGMPRAYAIVDAADAEWATQWRWHLGEDGYVIRTVQGSGHKRTISLHRELLGLVPGDGLEGDHRNHTPLDNRRGNLRKVATRSEQMQNKASHRGSSSSHRGVSWHKDSGKWTAYVQVNGRMKHLGLFKEEAEAAEVARTARARLLPFATD